VGEDCPDCELGRNKAVAGDDTEGLASRATTWFCGGGVVTPFLDGVLDGVGVYWLRREALAADRSGEPGAVDVMKDVLEALGFPAAPAGFLPFGWR
jgi:hypothetical protein